MALWKKHQPTLPSNTEPVEIPILPQHPVVYPVGTCVVTDTGNTYYINRDGKKYRITTDNVLDSWNFPLVVLTTDAALAKYPTAMRKLGFRDGSLLTNIADGKMYVVSDNNMRHITSPRVLQNLGVTRDDFMIVSDAEIKIMNEGEELY